MSRFTERHSLPLFLLLALTASACTRRERSCRSGRKRDGGWVSGVESGVDMECLGSTSQASSASESRPVARVA